MKLDAKSTIEAGKAILGIEFGTISIGTDFLVTHNMDTGDF